MHNKILDILKRSFMHTRVDLMTYKCKYISKVVYNKTVNLKFKLNSESHSNYVCIAVLSNTACIETDIQYTLQIQMYVVAWTFDFVFDKDEPFNVPNLWLFQPIYSEDDCTFREQIQPDGYNIYISIKHGALLSLGSHRQRLMGRDQDTTSLAQFLPRISTLEQTSHLGHHVSLEPALALDQKERPVDSVESLGKLSQMIHSPSFHKRWDGCSQTQWLDVSLGVIKSWQSRVLHTFCNVGRGEDRPPCTLQSATSSWNSHVTSWRHSKVWWP